MALQTLTEGGLPRVSFESVTRPQVAPLRTDIAIFIGATRWGEVGVPQRLEGWRAYEAAFGGFWSHAITPYAVRGYFDNGGRVAYVLRLAPGATQSSVVWDVTGDGGFAPAALGSSQFNIYAATTGSWGDALTVEPVYRRGDDGTPVIDLNVRLGGYLVEQHAALLAASLSEAVTEASEFIEVEPVAGAAAIAAIPDAGPNRRHWNELRLNGGDGGIAPFRTEYSDALVLATEEQEPALIALPDLHHHLGPDDAAAVLLAAARMADARLDRMVVADAPEDLETAIGATTWLGRFGNDPAVHRAMASYHPWLEVRDPLGTPIAPLRTIPPCGHVAGVISRLDREKGAYITPGNAMIRQSVDVTPRPTVADQGRMSEMGINALRCQSGRGIVVWGGRMTRSDDAPTRFVAHRRLIHRLVRSLRRVWQPMVFEPNNDALRLAIARSATSLLLEAFQTGALKGTRPEEAFRVNVDEALNEQAARDAGRVICEISIAPAIPMEFIHIRISVSADGEIEMVEP